MLASDFQLRDLGFELGDAGGLLMQYAPNVVNLAQQAITAGYGKNFAATRRMLADEIA